MLKVLILIALGGGVGSVCRYLLSRILSDFHWGVFPWATFAANLLGSLLIGVFYALSGRLSFSPEVRLMLTTGFCGGFTTFSTFSYENMLLLRGGDYLSFAFYVLLSVCCCVAGVALGVWLATR